VSKVSKTNKLYKSLGKNKKYIKALEGTILVIDPSCGSRSSLPGYSVYRKQELIDSGTLPITLGAPLFKRLHQMRGFIQLVENKYGPIDLAILEEIPVARGRFTEKSLASLMQAVGATVASISCQYIAFIHPLSWRAWMPPGYIKGDQADAELMGKVVLEYAKQVKADKAKAKIKKVS
jgi:hypothetical protein